MQIDEDIKHEVLKWKVEKIGQIIMLLILVLSFLGLLDPGLISDQKASNNYLNIEYNYFEHRQSPCRYKILLNKLQYDSSRYSISINADLINKLDIKSIVPTPERSYVTEGKVNYSFIKDPGITKTEIIIHYEGHRVGLYPVEIGMNNKVSLSFNQFFYP